MVISATKCLDGKRHNWYEVSRESVWTSDIKYCWCTKCGSRAQFNKRYRARRWERAVDVETNKMDIEIPSLLPGGSRKGKRSNMRKHMLETDVDEPLGVKT